MLNVRAVAANFSIALAAQGINMLVGVMTSLLVPKVLGVEAFGYWQLFIFYISYVTVFNLGLNDGIYLIHGGESRQTIDAKSIASQFWAGAVYQPLFALIIAIAAFLFVDESSRSFVIVMAGVFLVLNNLTAYMTAVFQAIDETRKFSASIAVFSVAYIVPLCVLLLLHVQDFRLYVMFYALARAVSLVYCVVKMGGLLRMGHLPLGATLKETLESIRVGVNLLIANISGSLIVGVARFLIDGNWGIEVFSMVSFALSMVTFFLMFISEASMVLFPALRKADESESIKFFESIEDLLELALPLGYLLYFPAIWLLGLWLPDYAQSFTFFAYMLPICIFEGKMNVVGATYLKVLRMERLLLIVNVAAMAASFAGALFGAYVIHSVPFVLMCPVLALAARAYYTDWRISRHFGLRFSKVGLGQLLLAAAFEVICWCLPSVLAFLATLACYVAFLAVNRKRVVSLIGNLRNLK